MNSNKHIPLIINYFDIGSIPSPLERGQGVCYLLILLSLFPFPGCTHLNTDEDWVRNGKVRVVLKWESSIRAAHTGDFDYYFYAEGSNMPFVRRGDVSGYEGILPVGHYDVVACNPDGRNLNLRMDGGYGDARAVARTSTTSGTTSATLLQPATLFGGGEKGITATAASSALVAITPVCFIRQVVLNIQIRGGGEVSVVNGSLSGIPCEVYIATGQLCPGRSGSVNFPAQETGENCYTASLSLFGLRAKNETDTTDPTLLSLTVEQKNGQSFISRTDITKQVNEAMASGLTARIELDLEVSPDEAGGYTLTVTAWRTGEAEAEGDMPDEK